MHPIIGKRCDKSTAFFNFRVYNKKKLNSVFSRLVLLKGCRAMKILGWLLSILLGLIVLSLGLIYFLPG
jgi:hypothetical protein